MRISPMSTQPFITLAVHAYNHSLSKFYEGSRKTTSDVYRKYEKCRESKISTITSTKDVIIIKIKVKLELLRKSYFCRRIFPATNHILFCSVLLLYLPLLYSRYYIVSTSTVLILQIEYNSAHFNSFTIFSKATSLERLSINSK